MQFVGTHDGVSYWRISVNVVNVVVIHVLAPWCAYWCGARCWHDVFDVGAVDVVIRWAAVQFVLRVRRHEVGTHEAHRWIVRFDRCPHDLL